MGRWSELLAPAFLRFAGISSGAYVLDVACGTGVLSKALADASAHVVGIDASEGYLEGARQHRSHRNITYESGDTRQMRFTDNAFDAAVSTLALDVLPEIEQVVVEMKRVNDRAAWSFCRASVSWRRASVRPCDTHSIRDQCRYRRCDPLGRGASNSGRTAGCAVAEDGTSGRCGKSLVVDCEYVIRGLLGDIHRWWQGIIAAHLMALPDRLRDEIEQHVRSGYLLGLPDGPRSFPMMFRAVRG
jgi:SAM-dependent methyltransferase